MDKFSNFGMVCTVQPADTSCCISCQNTADKNRPKACKFSSNTIEKAKNVTHQDRYTNCVSLTGFRKRLLKQPDTSAEFCLTYNKTIVKQCCPSKNYSNSKEYCLENAFSTLFDELFYILQSKLLIIFYLFFLFSFLSNVSAAPTSRVSSSNAFLPSDLSANNTTPSLGFSISHPPRLYVSPVEDADYNEISQKSRRSSGSKKGRRNNHKRNNNKRRTKRKNRQRGKKKNRNKLKPTKFPKALLTQSNTNSLKNSFSRHQRLYNKNGISFHLAVWRNGTVSGEKSNTRGLHSVLEIRGIGKGGLVAIKGVKAQRYICVTKKGRVKAKKKYNVRRCRFRERLLPNKQNTYESLSCHGCFLNLNKKGKVRKLKKTNPQLVQAHFLPRQVSLNAPHHYLASRRGPTLTIGPSDVGYSAKYEILSSARLVKNKKNDKVESTKQQNEEQVKPAKTSTSKRRRKTRTKTKKSGKRT